MKTLKKVMSLIIAMGMMLSLCTISADAATLPNIAQYEKGEAQYSNDFSDADKVNAFTSYNDFATKNVDSYAYSDGKLQITVAEGTHTTEYRSLHNIFASYCTGFCYVSFKMAIDDTLGQNVVVRMAYNGNAAGSLHMIFDTTNGKMKLHGQDDNVKEISMNEEHTYEAWLDYNNHKLWLFVDGNKEPLYAGVNFGDTTNTSSRLLRIQVDKASSTEGGNITIDDFKVGSLVEKTFMPAESANVAYSETFDYIDEKTAVTDEEYGYSSVNISSTATGSSASNADDMTITTDGKLSINGNGTQKAHCWYFGSTATTAMDNISGDMVISMDVRADKTNDSVMHKFNLGVGSDANCKLYMYANKSEAKVAGKDESGARSFVQFGSNFAGTGNTVNIVWLIDKETDRVSVWVDKVCMVENMKLQNTITKYSDINAINFSTNDQMYIDNLKVYEAADDEFYNINKVMRKVNSLADICTMNETDGLIENIDAADISSGDFTDATVTVTDSKGYYNGTDFIFPLEADEEGTDITITAAQNGITQSKTFALNYVPAAYTFEAINWGVEAPQAGSTFDCAVIPAKVRNAASDNGRLFIAAALYDATGETPVINAVGIQTDKLIENGEVAQGFPIILDLTSLEEIPATSKVKVFLWNSSMVPFSTEYENTYTK